LVLLDLGFFFREGLVLYLIDVLNLPIRRKDAAEWQIKFPRWISGKHFMENKEVDLEHQKRRKKSISHGSFSGIPIRQQRYY